MTARSLVLGVAIFAAGLGAGSTLPQRTHLYINGTLASEHVFEHDGQACVAIADVSKAMGWQVTPRDNGYTLGPAGGANQVAGLQGSVGQTLSNGQITFCVTQVVRSGHYAKQFSSGEAVPNNANEDVVIVVCRVKNARNKSQLISVIGGAHTALTDFDQHAYTPSRFSTDAQDMAPVMLPGSAVTFGLGFSVPKSARLKDLVFQINGGDLKESDFRISLGSNP